MVNVINNLEGEKVIYEYIKRKHPFLNDDVAKTEAKKVHNFELEYLISNEINKLKPKAIDQVNEQNEQTKWAAIRDYRCTINLYSLSNFSQSSESTDGDVDKTNDSTQAKSSDAQAVEADFCKTVENLNLNEEQLVSGTSKDDSVGKDASSQSITKSDAKNNSK